MIYTPAVLGTNDKEIRVIRRALRSYTWAVVKMYGICRSKSSRILTRSCNESSQSHETFKEFRERKFIIKCIFMEIKMWLKHSRDQMSSPCWNSVGSKGLRRTSQGKGVASYNSSYTWKKERSASLNRVVAMLWYVLTLRCWTSRPRIFS